MWTATVYQDQSHQDVACLKSAVYQDKLYKDASSWLQHPCGLQNSDTIVILLLWHTADTGKCCSLFQVWVFPLPSRSCQSPDAGLHHNPSSCKVSKTSQGGSVSRLLVRQPPSKWVVLACSSIWTECHSREIFISKTPLVLDKTDHPWEVCWLRSTHFGPHSSKSISIVWTCS